jgi:trimeric autotransporter adhesin
VPGPCLRRNRPPLKQLERLCIVATCAILGLSAGSTAAIAQAISRVPSINTTVGNGTAGYSGDGGPAGSAELNGPSGIALDGAGNLYIADPANNRIREVMAGTRIISTIAGNGTAGYSGDGGPATSAELQSPVGIAVDSSGNLYIADQGNNVIRKVATNGTITTVAGNNAEGYSGDNGQAINATLYAPAGVALDNAGNLYIADAGNNRIRLVNTAGTITTFAGNGTAGYSGDNGPAAAATLNKPSALAEDAKNNLYLADTSNNVIRLVNTTGTITTIAGNGTAGYSGDNGSAISATLNAPYGLQIDSVGNVYIADTKNNVIRMVTAAGNITTIVGNGASGFSGDGGPATDAILNNPIGVVFGSQGNLDVSDQGNERVREVNTPAGSVVFPTTVVTSTSAAITIPLQVNTPGTTITSITVPVSQGGKQEYAVAAPGCPLNTSLNAGTACNVTVTFAPGYPGLRPVPLQVATSSEVFNFGMSGIGTAPQVALSPGIITTIASTVPGNYSVTSPLYLQYGYTAHMSGGLVVDNAGNVYASVDAPEGRDQAGSAAEFPPGTNTLTPIFGFGAGAGNLGLALDSANNVYAAAPGSNCIEKFVQGSPLFPAVVAGTCNNGPYTAGPGGYSGDNGLAVSAQLNAPTSVAVDTAGNLYIADSGNNRIRKITAISGIITTIAGNGTAGFSGDNGPAGNAELHDPTAVALDNLGDLYIADSGNNRIRKLTLGSGVITTVAGDGTAGYSGDNGLATSAELNAPASLAIDSVGDVYVVDSSNNVVRMVNPAGIISTVAGNGGTGATGDGGPATGAGLLEASGVTLDSLGNLYISTFTGVRTVNVSASALNFPSAQIGSTSQQTVTVTNIGNAPLSFTVPTSSENPSIPTGFAQDSSSTCPQLSAGSQPVALAPGGSCALVVDFLPTSTAAVTGSASITDNALNTSATQTVQLTAGAGETVATTTTLNVATPTFGATAVSATILATTGTLVPVGSVVFTVDGALQPAVTGNNSGIATLPSAVSNPLAVGSHTIDATYASSSLGFGNSVATRIFSVSEIPPSVTIAPSAPSLSVAPGSSVTDTLTITSVGGYAGSLQLSCSNLPQNATCSFQPSTVALSGTTGPQTTVVTIQTAGSTAGVHLQKPFTPQGNAIRLAAVFWAPGLLGIVLARRKRRTSSRGFYWVVMLALLAGTLVVSGCGGGGSAPANTTSKTPPSTPATPAGTSTVQITASAAGTTVQSFALTLTVQ